MHLKLILAKTHKRGRSSYLPMFLATMMLMFFLCTGTATAQPIQYVDSASDSLLRVQAEELKSLKFRITGYVRQDSIKRANILLQFMELEPGMSGQDDLELQLNALDRSKVMYKESIIQKIDSIRLFAIGAPVLFSDDTVFHIYTHMGLLSPTERVLRVNQELGLLVQKGLLDPEQITIVNEGESAKLLYKDVLLHTITDADAAWHAIHLSNLADQYSQSLKAAIKNQNIDAGNILLLQRIGLILLVILVMILFILGLNRLFQKLFSSIMGRSNLVLKRINFRHYELLSEAQAARIIQSILNLLKWPIILIILYLVLPFLFRIFPKTRSISAQMFELIAGPLRKFGATFIAFIPELITIVIIILITRFIVNGLRYFSREIAAGRLKVHGFYPDWALPTFNLVRLILYAIAFVMIFPLLPGSHSPAFKGVSIFFGVLISLGSSSFMGNLIAGLVITYMRAFQIGDRVKIDQTTGEVIEKTILITRIRTIKNEEVTIPNSTILNGSTVNYTTASTDRGLILNTAVTIGYDVPWREVHQLLISAAKETKNVLELPQPFVLQTSLDDFYVSYQINAYTANPELSAVIYSELHSKIQDAFRDAKVEIMSPHYRANRDGDAATIPE